MQPLIAANSVGTSIAIKMRDGNLDILSVSCKKRLNSNPDCEQSEWKRGTRSGLGTRLRPILWAQAGKKVPFKPATSAILAHRPAEIAGGVPNL